MKRTTQLREMITRPEILLAPGTYDPMMAKVIENAGFEAVYMTGAGVSHTTLAQPDLGLVTMTEMVAQAGRIVDAVEVPVLADADNGYGNALNVMRTIREYERAGVAGVHIEDQTLPKKCGHFEGKTVIPKAEMIGKLKAALDARQDEDFVIIARTDARTAVSLEAALDRAVSYAEVGADVIFLESPLSLEELRRVPAEIKKPLMANMVEFGKTPLLSAAELEALGYSLVIFPNALARFLLRQAMEFLEGFRQEGTTRSQLERMLSFQDQNRMLGLEKFEGLRRRYEGA